ncbi:3-carboxy-cis,cis-muconate cycloisomerase [Roseobacter fucihabitans]|uniref:3-carboxy-cis,cis-muconate cycloisomerase n=1 Tax=Roseobacter fucihabitans TaxID=1537242 RepID=A0ABZ2BWD2_9RHOB|nr:lyase family protein [Roseobacter litoralis]MBC6965023.1 3-carboxy-cis,cis-muconate cycloisomerase [Roseobacter litoralis]
MAASVFDSPLYARLFDTGETGRLFSDTAALRAMLLVEGALAKAQGKHGVIPEISAAAIHRATLEIQIDPGALAKATGENGVCIPGLVAAFRAEMNAPEHAQYVHWGATSQDIIDTGLMLRLRQALALAEADLRTILTALADQAEKHADLPMPARTYGQQATPTSWGAVLASWGAALLDAVDALPGLREQALWVSLSGASGTSAALGPKAAQIRADLAQGLGLRDPHRSWHIDRGPILRIIAWMAQVCATLAAIGQTVIGLSASEVQEVSLGAAGASSTMPQKQNPVRASTLVALSTQISGLQSTLQIAATHQHQRDGAAWFAEWMIVPQIALSTACALQHGVALARDIRPNPTRMAQAFERGLDLAHSEALSFALSQSMSRPKAQAAVKTLCQEALRSGTSLSNLARAQYPDLPASLFDPQAQLGEAPADTRAFVARVRAL